MSLHITRTNDVVATMGLSLVPAGGSGALLSILKSLESKAVWGRKPLVISPLKDTLLSVVN